MKIRLRDIHSDDLDLFRYWQQPGHLWQALDGPYYPRATPEEVESTVKAIEERIESTMNRELIIGHSERNQLLIVSFTERDDIIRIISARTAKKRGRDSYEQYQKR